MFALGIWTWPSAPAQIPIHWNIEGQVNGYAPKSLGLLLMPTIATALYAIVRLAAVIRREQLDGRAMSALSWFRLACVILMAGVFAVIVADARGADVNMNYVVFPLLGLNLIAIANLAVQTNRNKSARKVPPAGGIRI